MRRSHLQLFTVAVLASCAGVGEWEQVELVAQDGSRITLAKPPDDVLTSEAGLRLKALGGKGRELASGSLEVRRAFVRVRQENPALDAQRVTHYYLGLAFASGGLTRDEYGRAVRELFELSGRSVADREYVPDRPSLTPTTGLSLEKRTDPELAHIGDMEALAERKLPLRSKLNRILNESNSSTSLSSEDRAMLARVASDAQTSAAELDRFPDGAFRYCDYVNYYCSLTELWLISATAKHLLGVDGDTAVVAQRGSETCEVALGWIAATRSRYDQEPDPRLSQTVSYIARYDFEPQMLEAQAVFAAIKQPRDAKAVAGVLKTLQSRCQALGSEYCRTFDPKRFAPIRDCLMEARNR